MSYSKQNFRSGDTLYASQLNAMDDEIATLEAEVESTKNMVGSPLTASTAAGMSDQTKIYVYTGSETGYTAGHWYYYNGTAWTDGGVYNSVAVNTDTSLTVPGQAADSKAVGDAIDDLDSNLSDVKSDLSQLPKVVETEKSGVDLDVIDQRGNVILRLADGHIQTKNFDSADVEDIQEELDGKLDDNFGSSNAGKILLIDQNGDVVAGDKPDGGGDTKAKSTTASADLDFADNDGNVLMRLMNGHIKTKYFNSAESQIITSTGDSTDRSSDIANALLLGGCVTLGVGNFYVESLIAIPEGATIRGQGDSTIIIVNNASMESVFTMTTRTTIENLTIQGTLNALPPSMGTMHGVKIVQQNSNNRIENVNFIGLSGAGVYSIYSYVNMHNSNIIANCRFDYCGCGVYIGQRSEAFVVMGCVVLNSYIGIYCIGGNNRIVANIIRGCIYGINMASTSSSDNDGHSSFSSLIVIHNAHAVHIDTIEFGSIFNGCCIFNGDVSIADSTGIMFVGCEIGNLDQFSAIGSSGIRLSNCIFYNIEPSVVSGATINDCTKLDGTAFQ